jgi:hypothetical protein
MRFRDLIHNTQKTIQPQLRVRSEGRTSFYFIVM